MTIDEMKLLIENTPARKLDRELYRLSLLFEDNLLVEKVFLDDYFEFFLWLLCNPSTSKSSGLSHFIVAVFTDRHKLSACQKLKLLEIIVKYVPNFKQEIVRYAVGDFIARTYDVADARSAAQDLCKDGSSESKYVAFVILELVMKRLGPEEPEWKVAQSLMKHLTHEGS